MTKTTNDKRVTINKGINKKRISSDIVHLIFHKPQGVFATISSEQLWEDVKIIPTIDLFCTSCKITSIPHASRRKTRPSTPRKFLQEIQVDIVLNPEPLG